MRRSTLTAALLTFGVALLLTTAGTAAAAHKVIHRRASFSFEAQLPSRDGYALYLRAKNHRDIELDVEREGAAEPYVTMTYRVKGQVGRDGIEADLGRFGRVDLRSSGTPERHPYRLPNCRPSGPAVREDDLLRGDFRFASLGGTVKLSVDHVEAETRREPRRSCVRGRSRVSSGRGSSSARPLAGVRKGEFTPAEEEELAPVSFLARAHEMGRTIDLFALGPELERIVDLVAESTRRFGPVVVSTSLHAVESSRAEGGLEVSITGKGPRPTGATVEALAPFSGLGTYTYEPGSPPSFLGSLEVRIPGEGTLPLAGPGFHAVICHFIVVKQQQACEETVAPAHEV
jgi:hypothetical protein